MDLLHDAAGTVLRPDDGTVQLAIEVHPTADLSYEAVDLRYRVNGGSERTQRLPESGKVCVAAERPAFCEFEE